MIFGLFSFILKSSRYIYILLSFESMMMGMLMYNMSVVSELNFILLLVTSVVSSVLGLLMMVIMMASYGNEFMKF